MCFRENKQIVNRHTSCGGTEVHLEGIQKVGHILVEMGRGFMGIQPDPLEDKKKMAGKRKGRRRGGVQAEGMD